MQSMLTDCEKFHRRDVLRAGMFGLLGLTLPQYYALADQSAKSFATADSAVLIWLAGGPSHIDTFDPKPEAPYEIRGSFSAVEGNVSGMRLSQHLQRTARNSDKLCVVRSLTSPTGAHEIGTHYMLTGFLPLPGFAVPSYGAVTSHLMGPRGSLPPYISVSPPSTEMGAGFLGSALQPFSPGGDPAQGNYRVRDLDPSSGMTVERLDRRRALRDVVDSTFKKHEAGSDKLVAVDSFYQRAYKLLSSSEARDAFDLRKEPDATRNDYGRNTFGQSLLLSRRLVEAGVRFVTVTLGGWDNHSNIFNALGGGQLPKFDQSFGAFLEDLQARGLLKRTLIVVMGEFGRTPIINKDGGRDHYPRVFSMLLAGGGVHGGTVVGSSDARGMEPVEDAVRPEDVSATIYRCLGIDHTQSISSPEGVRIALSRGGNPIKRAVG